jgi:hypothetical protein
MKKRENRMKTVKRQKCVVAKRAIRCGRDLFRVTVEYLNREKETWVQECLTGDGTLCPGVKCLLRTIKIVGDEVQVVERL